jgi:hypothetical protein
MGVCEPGQGGNAAAISNTFMCLGEPPRLSLVPAWESCRGQGKSAVPLVVAGRDRQRSELTESRAGPGEYASWSTLGSA